MPTSPAPAGMPLLRLGFRPFYLGAAAAAVALMGLWFFVFTGRLDLATGLAPVLWHSHEMIFGVVSAVVIGFLFTAGQAWTGLPTPRGAALGSLVALWLAARVAAVAAPYPVFFPLDASLLPLAAGVFAAHLVRARNYRNLPVALVLALLGLANAMFHLAVIGVLTIDARATLDAGLALLIVLETVIGGRVIPMFTMNATPGLRLRGGGRRDLLTVALTFLGLGAWVFGVMPRLTAALLAAAAALHAWRALSWAPWRTLGRPILAILHLAYAWIPAGLALLALAVAQGSGESPAVHALAVGATGGLVIGMITRTARGHTGRVLQASKIEVLAYVLVMAAALVRVTAPLVWPTAYSLSLLASGSLWMSAFALYLWRYVPWLTAPRVDGKDG